ncbi:folylpolyglutamate synthase [Candidatus Blochmanniella floridana]|uniref:Dihydrofolate synthase/folylpolyglutamate synthase n=1 Tax=Blochmanniella floridana TaxID=203907 RepID=Q7VRV1_BLOFL|nr:folylpolyglutamate synthase [Candidatus Blochmannia floridanus]
MRKCTLVDWLDYIQNLNPVVIDLNLERIRSVAFALKLIPFEIYTVLVGGTNGKGTTCFLLESILLHSDIKVGLYTSPHLLFYNERIRVCGQVLSDDVHIQAMIAIEQVRSGVKLTYFEFITLSALYIFKKFQLDVVILEVGLGGRLDATNVVDPDVSVITNIEMDHTDILGTTHNDIAIEKAGIFRAKKPVIFGSINRPCVIDKIIKYQKSVLFARGRDWNVCCYKNEWVWFSYNVYKNIINLPFSVIPLENAATVISVLHWLPFLVSKKSICYGLKHVTVLGRFQVINYEPLVVLDVGHNPHAAFYIISKLSAMVSTKGIVRVVIGMLKNKDIKKTIFCLSKLVNIWYCAKLNTSLSFSMEQLCSYFDDFNVKYFEDVISAWKQAIADSHKNDCVLVFGSFYAVSPIIRLISKN